jgi:hypothetical protein
MEGPPDVELMITRFNRLVKEILSGEVRRTSFQPWEVLLLLDLEECRLTRSRRDEVLRRYQRTVQRQLERRQIPPTRFSEFHGWRSRKLLAHPCVTDPRVSDPRAIHPPVTEPRPLGSR